MKALRSVIILLCFLLVFILPVSAVNEFPGRYYTSGGCTPFWNTENGLCYLGGGFNSSFGWAGMSNDTWMSPIGSSGGVWTNMTGSPGWKARYTHKITPVGARLLLLTGGTTGAVFFNDTWLSTNGGTTWAVQPAVPWRTRQGHIAPSGSACMIVSGGTGTSGGYGAGFYYNDTWATYDWGTSWALKTLTPPWQARYLHAATSDGSNFLFMGGLNVTSAAMNDVWSTSDCGGNWTMRKANTGGTGSATDPSPRYNHGLVVTDNAYVLFGGTYGGVYRNDSYMSQDGGATWIRTTANAPWKAREGFMYGYDFNKHLIVMAGGGAGGANYFNDVWTSADNGFTWNPYYSTTYATPGTYSWTAPSGVRNLSMNIAGGGGSGAPSALSGSVPGGGGGKAQYSNYSGLPVTPFTSYSVIVGLNATNTPAGNGVGYYGYPSTALGKTKAGGQGGVMGISCGTGSGTSCSGGAGESTDFMTLSALTTLALGGESGALGTGYGAGAPGAGYSCAVWCAGNISGAGAPGIVRIHTEGSWFENTPEFTTPSNIVAMGIPVTFTDTSRIRNPAGLTYLWEFGDGTTSSTQGTVNHTYSYAGAFTVTLTVGSTTGSYPYTVENAISTTGSNSQTWYSPSQVRFTVLDYLGNNVIGARVNATYVASTMPDAASWLSSVYGVSSTIATQMLSTNTVMSGLTGSDGAVVFTMHSSLQYNVTANDSFGFISTKIYPKESDYNIWLPAIPSNNTYAQIEYNLTFWEPNASYYTMGATYQDNSSQTMRVSFYVNATNGTSINYTTMINPGSNLLNVTKTIPNIRGDAFYWGLNVVRSTPDMSGKGNISASRGVTSRGANGVLVDLSLPNGTTYYPWIAFFLLLMITSLASKANVRFMLVIMAVMAAMFWWFGWLQGIYLTTVIPFACFLGAIFYMKGSLRENYGVGGSGSMLVNIVVFLIILQMMIGFINGIGIFNQAAMMTPSNQFTNVDLTTIQNTTSNFGGINDPLQSANAYASIGWATFKILLMMIGAVFVVAPFLIEMFPYVPATFFLILQAGIWVIYVLFIAKAAGKLGSEVDF